MKVLGLGTEGDSGAAIVEDGRILAAVNEERLSRLKLDVSELGNGVRGDDGRVRVLDFGLAKLTEFTGIGGSADSRSPTIVAKASERATKSTMPVEGTQSPAMPRQ